MTESEIEREVKRFLGFANSFRMRRLPDITLATPLDGVDLG
jgi:hypothetical protein